MTRPRSAATARAAVAAAAAAAVATASVAGCAPGDAARPGSPDAPGLGPPRDFASGSRLRARYDVVGGAVEVFVAFHDVALDVDCAFGDDVGPGGISWCVPVAVARHQESSGPYADAACTDPVALAPRGADAAWAVLSPRDACVAGPRVHRALPSKTARVYGLADDGTCLRSASAFAVQRLGEELPVDTFVAARETGADPGEARRIVPRALAAIDGARLVVGGLDVPRKAPAEVSRMRWVPSRVAFVGAGNDRFADDACAERLATKIAHDARCPPTAAFVFADACGNGDYRAIGDPAPRTAARLRDVKGACVAARDDAVLAFTMSEAIPFESFAPATTTDVGADVARRRGYGADGAPIVWGEIIDAATGDACVVATASDGARRCLPAASELVAYFADAACTQPAFAHALTGCEGAAGPRLPHLVRDVATGRAFAVGAAARALFEIGAGGACAPFEPVVSSARFAADEVSVDRFPTVERRSED